MLEIGGGGVDGGHIISYRRAASLSIAEQLSFIYCYRVLCPYERPVETIGEELTEASFYRSCIEASDEQQASLTHGAVCV